MKKPYHCLDVFIYTIRMQSCRSVLSSFSHNYCAHSGCSGVVVKEKFVGKQEYTGDTVALRLADNTLHEAPEAKIMVDTHLVRGEVDALCLPDAAYDLIIGNVVDARQPYDPRPMWKDARNTTTGVDALRKHGADSRSTDSSRDQVEDCEACGCETAVEQQKHEDLPVRKNHGAGDAVKRASRVSNTPKQGK